MPEGTWPEVRFGDLGWGGVHPPLQQADGDFAKEGERSRGEHLEVGKGRGRERTGEKDLSRSPFLLCIHPINIFEHLLRAAHWVCSAEQNGHCFCLLGVDVPVEKGPTSK